MGIWKSIREKIKKKNTHHEEKDITFPESKGKITIEAIRQNLSDIDDAVIKEIALGQERATLIYMKTLVEKKILQDMILTPLEGANKGFREDILKTAQSVESNELPQLLYDITSGYTVLILHGQKRILKIDTNSPPNRTVSSPESETTVLGPSDSFTESIDINIGLIKKRIASTKLKVKSLLLGTESRNKIAVLYMDNIANKENVDRVLYRLNNIEYQGFWDISILQQMLEDKPYSPFPQFGITVRPDNTVSALLDGRIIIFMNDSPEAVIAPISFFEMFTTPEDYYNRWTTATLLRFLRLGGFFITIILTPLYISVLTYHPEMLPATMLTILIESRMKVPFPPVLETLLIEMFIEILREAGARMPTKIGQTIGIVGGIVIGTAAVEAGLASNILIVLVAISALLSFLPPNFLMSNAARFIRYLFIIAAGTFGLYGQMLALAWLFIHLTNLTSLGSPYMSPIIPRTSTDLLDSVFRAPINFLYKRKGLSRADKQLTRPLDEE